MTFDKFLSDIKYILHNLNDQDMEKYFCQDDKLHSLLEMCVLYDSGVDINNQYIYCDLFTDKRIRRKFSEKQLSKKSLLNYLTKLKQSIKSSLNNVQYICNANMEQLYKSGLAKDRKYKTYINLDSFLLQHQNHIYTIDQLINLLSRLDEVKNPTKKALYIKSKYSMKFFDNHDFGILDKLEDKIKLYFKLDEM